MNFFYFKQFLQNTDGFNIFTLKEEIDKFTKLYTHGSLAEFEYADTQILTAKSIDLAEILINENEMLDSNIIKKTNLKQRDD